MSKAKESVSLLLNHIISVINHNYVNFAIAKRFSRLIFKRFIAMQLDCCTLQSKLEVTFLRQVTSWFLATLIFSELIFFPNFTVMLLA